MENKKLELAVGVFLLIGLVCLGYLSFNLGQVKFLGGSDYLVYATFSNVGGLRDKASVTMAGVQIGQVQNIQLKDGQAVVTLAIHKGVKLEDDVIASVKTMGIIGDKYVSISPGGSSQYIPPGGKIIDTQPPIDIEELLSKYVFGKV